MSRVPPDDTLHPRISLREAGPAAAGDGWLFDARAELLLFFFNHFIDFFYFS